jgi:ribonuclease HII
VTPGSWPTYREEIALQAQGYVFVAGIDEAGRGPLAGPVVAGAVVLPPDWFGPSGRRRRTAPASLLNDSKQLTAEQREVLYGEIVGRALAWGAGVVARETIDRIGIVRATRLAMRQAVEAMGRRPEALLVDAVDLPELGLPCKAIIDGDALCGSIAAASVVASTGGRSRPCGTSSSGRGCFDGHASLSWEVRRDLRRLDADARGDAGHRAERSSAVGRDRHRRARG